MSEIQLNSWDKVIDNACIQIAQVHAMLANSGKATKMEKATCKLLENLSSSCRSIKKYSATETAPIRGQKRLVQLLKKLGHDPMLNVVWQEKLGAVQVALFWQAMYQLQIRITPFDRAVTVSKSRRLGKVERISQEQLDPQP